MIVSKMSKHFCSRFQFYETVKNQIDSLLYLQIKIFDHSPILLSQKTSRQSQGQLASFRRAAFYSHPEKDYAAGLWAVMKTRFVWEQEVMPRLSVSKRSLGHNVTQTLLRLADVHIEILGVEPSHLDQITRAGFASKSRFIERVRRQGKIKFRFVGRRDAVLSELRTALRVVGVDESCVGDRNFSPQE
ncbi:MAG: hypothetical protein JXR76_09180 [Deltaproteobacteria bacterium]|nr:hypothetical protein [Deltaproteobacteria bacterium]